MFGWFFSNSPPSLDFGITSNTSQNPFSIETFSLSFLKHHRYLRYNYIWKSFLVSHTLTIRQKSIIQVRKFSTTIIVCRLVSDGAMRLNEEADTMSRDNVFAGGGERLASFKLTSWKIICDTEKCRKISKTISQKNNEASFQISPWYVNNRSIHSNFIVF